MRKILFITAIVSIIGIQFANAQSDIHFAVRAGYNVGAVTPLGLPASIRGIEAFRLGATVMAGCDVALPLSEKLGIATGLRVENKGMDAEVKVKSYRMEMEKGGSGLSGFFTGHVQQKVSQWMVTLPVQGTYRLGEKLTLKAGPFISLLLSREFSGIASGGYLRQGDPTGPKVEIGDKEGEWATYDFSEEMRRLQWGVSVGVDWLVAGRVGMTAELQWGLSGIFNSDFKTVEQSLYPIYGCLSLFYRL